MATLVFKMSALTLKTLSKPLAARFESYVMNHPVLRQRTINLAQALHRFEVTISRGAEGKTGKAFVGDITEDKAVQLASKFVSEGFLYGTAIVLLLLETDRRKKDDAKKKEKEAADKNEIQDMHARHVRAEEELRVKTDRLEEVFTSLDERLRGIEVELMKGR